MHRLAFTVIASSTPLPAELECLTLIQDMAELAAAVSALSLPAPTPQPMPPAHVLWRLNGKPYNRIHRVVVGNLRREADTLVLDATLAIGDNPIQAETCAVSLSITLDAYNEALTGPLEAELLLPNLGAENHFTLPADALFLTFDWPAFLRLIELNNAARAVNARCVVADLPASATLDLSTRTPIEALLEDDHVKVYPDGAVRLLLAHDSAYVWADTSLDELFALL